MHPDADSASVPLCLLPGSVGFGGNASCVLALGARPDAARTLRHPFPSADHDRDQRDAPEDDPDSHRRRSQPAENDAVHAGSDGYLLLVSFKRRGVILPNQQLSRGGAAVVLQQDLGSSPRDHCDQGRQEEGLKPKYSIDETGPRIESFLRQIIANARFDLNFIVEAGEQSNSEFETPDLVVKFTGEDVDLILSN